MVTSIHQECKNDDEDSVSEKEKEQMNEMFYITMHSTHFIYGYIASEIW